MPKEFHYKLNLGFTLYPLQQSIYDHVVGDITGPNGDPYRFFVLCFGRQSGKSFFCKKLALDRAVNQREKVMWVAPAISTAQTHWDDIEAVVSRAMEKGFKVKSINQSRKQIKFYGGGQITIRSAIQPDRLRGPSLDLIILDEAAFFPDGDNTFTSIIQPMVTATGGKIVLASTPNGRNWFYNIYKRGLAGSGNVFYKSWTSTSLDSPYQDKALLEDIRTSIPLKKWREEYLAEFMADAGGVFAGVEEAAKNEMLYEPLPGHDYVMGIDIGFVNDETAVCIIDKYTREQVYGESWSSVGTLATLRRLARLFDVWQPEVTLFEKNGLGETFFDLIKAVFSGRDPDEHLLATIFDTDDEEYDPYDDSYREHYGSPDDYNVIPFPRKRGRNEITVNGMTIRGVHMNNEMKRAYVDGLSADVEYRRLTLLKDDTDYGMKQINQMSTYERKPTATGMSVTYSAQDGEHDDLVAALYLARKALPKMTRQKTRTDNDQPRTNPFRGGKKTQTRWHKRGA